MRPVYVTATSVLRAGIDSSGLLPQILLRGESASATRRESVDGMEVDFTEVGFDESDPLLPTGRYRKIMRRDVALAVIGFGRLVAQLDSNSEDLEDAALFLATGLSQDKAMEDQIVRLCEEYFAEADVRTESERNARFFRALPPLTALSGLSNFSACLVAQLYGVRGPNAVFGVTSHSGHTAFRQGFLAVGGGDARMAMAGGANAVGLLSALIFRAVARGRGRAWEAEGSAFVLLESEESMEESGRKPLCRVRSASSTPGLPGFPPVPGQGCRTALEKEGNDDAHPILFGGSVFEEDRAAMARDASQFSQQALTWFEGSGSLGAASVAFDVSTGAEMIAQGLSSGVRCWNRDIFGRESLIWLEKAG